MGGERRKKIEREKNERIMKEEKREGVCVVRGRGN